MTFDSFLSDIGATIVGGLFLALLFFWANEKVFRLPDVTGRSYFELTTLTSAYNPYSGMVLRYLALLWREEHRVRGTAEKIYERSSTGERSYIGRDRTRVIVEGYIEKRYFSRHKVFLHIIEDGHGRESSAFYELSVLRNGQLSGVFHSMVADQSGTVTWQREPF
ncbi:MAG TPA: hypothetical protein VNJ70_00970 [Thermoanaerobaculia bacterium]|nr:hypothetical protein [Thermoanaerobaculia bacterium]